MGRTLGQWIFLAVVLGCAACGELTQATVGYAPSPAPDPATVWSPVPGAFAYQVVVSLDRAGMAPVGITAMLSDYQLDPAKIVWHQGHPIADRPYFWVVRAFDRPDPQGIMLSVSEPREITFGQQAGGLTVTYQEPTPTPSTTTAPSPLTGPSASP